MFSLFVIFFINLNASDKAEIDKKAPEFKLKDTNGKEHSLSEYSGKFVVLEWNNFDCPFVKKHYNTYFLINITRIKKKHNNEKLSLLILQILFRLSVCPFK